MRPILSERLRYPTEMTARAGRYELLGTIASGGMATVHLGKAVGVAGFERLVAIKVMHQQFASDSEYVTMFLDEARLAARIRHPNVVATHDVQHDDQLFIVMDYVEGPALSAVVRKQRKARSTVPVSIAVRIFIDLLSGLHAAHELCDDDDNPLQLVHRDVSPQNILVGVDGVTRITDFGVAHAAVRMATTRSGQLKGKMGYMSPEQVRGQPIDRRSDIFAAGVVLWELLTGKRLFKADNEAAVVLSLIEGAKRSPAELNPEVPQFIDQVCMRSLSIKASDRFATTADFLEALEHAAFADNLAIASTRAVAEYVKLLDAHQPVEPASNPQRLGEARSDADLFSGKHSGQSRVAVLSRRPASRSKNWPVVAAGLALSGLAFLGYRTTAPAHVSTAVSQMVPAVGAAATDVAPAHSAPRPTPGNT
jgi:serine/threonine protein kinase